MVTRVVHCKKEQYDVYCGRPNFWGNPFYIGRHGTREEVIKLYKEWIYRQPDLVQRAKTELKDKILACWCSPLSCHADVLAEIANNE